MEANVENDMEKMDGLDPWIYGIYAEGRSRNKECQRREYGHSQQKGPTQPRKQRVVPVQLAENFCTFDGERVCTAARTNPAR